jgi:uncharacterized membrane protein YfhO
MQAPDYGGELLLADGEEFENDVGQGLNERVQITVDEPEHVVLDVNADFDAYVVLLDAWDSGWSAFVDGQAAPIHRADLIFRAVRVGAGQHRVEFIYRPRSLYVGIVVAAVSVGILGIVVITIWLISRRSHRAVI